jgi:hypothetical protein
MGSFQRWCRAAPRSRAHASVFALGRRVDVACARDRLAHAALTDDAGQCAGPLADGTEVEILAWRPRGSDGTFWRVRSTRKGLEGWLAGGQLTEYSACRLSPHLASSDSHGFRAVASDGVRESGRRFGQRAN